MLRVPFVRLFGPLFGSALATEDSTKRQSYPMSWRSNHPHGVAGTGNRSNVSHTKSESQRDSEDGSIDHDVLPPRRARRGSGINVTNEFSVQSAYGNVSRKQETETRSESNDGDTNTAASIEEDKSDGKSPFYHVSKRQRPECSSLFTSDDPVRAGRDRPDHNT
jgi:hypothetical protein